MQIKRLVVETAHLMTLAAFYADVMGLPVQFPDEKRILMNIGATDMIFLETEQTEPFYHFAINIPSNKIEGARSWIRDKVNLLWLDDYKAEVADFVNWHARSVYFYDPAGNILELIARSDLNNAIDEPFSPGQFLSVSEIGLVFQSEHFDQQVAALQEKYALTYFSKQPPLPQFKVIGDDEGLFIIVPENRAWYPTDKPAGIFPMRIEFENGGKGYAMDM